MMPPAQISRKPAPVRERNRKKSSEIKRLPQAREEALVWLPECGDLPVKGIFRRFHYFLQARLQLMAFGRIVNPRALSVCRLAPRAGWCFQNPDPSMEKESLYELDDQRSPS
jgi:hypothetical protein